MDNTEKAYGFVVLLDALGVSNFDIEESEEFLKNTKTFLKLLNNKLEIFDKQGFKLESEPKFFIFGDTILLTINTGKKSNLHYLLLALAEWLRPAILSGLTNKILWRGAVSVGRYICTDKIAIGPAIADAASWYEKPQMFGIVATPSCGIYLDHLKEQFEINHKNGSVEDEFKLNNFFYKYDVLLKNNQTHKLWTVAWPNQFKFIDKIDIASKENYSPLRMYYSLLQEFNIALGTENKYINTEEYFKKYLDDTM